MSDSSQFARLFSPLQVGRRAVRSRMALAATPTNCGAGNCVTMAPRNLLCAIHEGDVAAMAL